MAVAPDYAEYVKFADTWLPAKAGTDGALAMAMTFVILKEFFLERQTPYFHDYVTRYTDLPFVIRLERNGAEYVSDRFLRASDLGMQLTNGDWKTVLFDAKTRAFVVPHGSLGFRWGEKEQWNLHLKEALTGAEVDPQLSFGEDRENDGWLPVKFPLFELQRARPANRDGPGQENRPEDNEEVLVTTVFDLFSAHLGLDRGHGGDCARDYDDPQPFSPAWQEAITGVPAADAIRVAREFLPTPKRPRASPASSWGLGSTTGSIATSLTEPSLT